MEAVTDAAPVGAEGERERIARQTYSLDEAATLLGIGRSLGYELARRGSFPVPVVKLGRRLVVSRAALNKVLAGEPA